MKKKKNPNDSTVKNIARLRKEVRILQKQVNNLQKYYNKRFEEVERTAYNLHELIKIIIGSIE